MSSGSQPETSTKELQICHLLSEHHHRPYFNGFESHDGSIVDRLYEDQAFSIMLNNRDTTFETLSVLQKVLKERDELKEKMTELQGRVADGEKERNVSNEKMNGVMGEKQGMMDRLASMEAEEKKRNKGLWERMGLGKVGWDCFLLIMLVLSLSLPFFLLVTGKCTNPGQGRMDSGAVKSFY